MFFQTFIFSVTFGNFRGATPVKASLSETEESLRVEVPGRTLMSVWCLWSPSRTALGLRLVSVSKRRGEDGRMLLCQVRKSGGGRWAPLRKRTGEICKRKLWGGATTTIVYVDFIIIVLT